MQEDGSRWRTGIEAAGLRSHVHHVVVLDDVGGEHCRLARKESWGCQVEL